MIARRSRQTTVAANHLVRIRVRVRIREGLGYVRVRVRRVRAPRDHEEVVADDDEHVEETEGLHHGEGGEAGDEQ